MIILNINEKKYKLPTKSNEITYRLGKKIDDIIKEYPDMSIEGKKWILATLINVDYDIVDLITDNQIELLLDNHIMFSDDLKINHGKFIKVDGTLYQFKGLDAVTVDIYAQRELFIINEDYDFLFFSLYEKVSWYKSPFIKNAKTIGDINYFQFKITLYLYYQWKSKLLDEYAINDNNKNIPKEQQSDGYMLTSVEKFGIYHILMQIVKGSLIEYKEWMGEDIRVLFKYILYQNLVNQKSS